MKKIIFVISLAFLVILPDINLLSQVEKKDSLTVEKNSLTGIFLDYSYDNDDNSMKFLSLGMQGTFLLNNDGIYGFEECFFSCGLDEAKNNYILGVTTGLKLSHPRGDFNVFEDVGAGIVVIAKSSQDKSDLGLNALVRIGITYKNIGINVNGRYIQTKNNIFSNFGLGLWYTF